MVSARVSKDARAARNPVQTRRVARDSKVLTELVSYLADVFHKKGMAGVGEALGSVAEQIANWSEREIWGLKISNWVRSERKSPESVLNIEELGSVSDGSRSATAGTNRSGSARRT